MAKPSALKRDLWSLGWTVCLFACIQGALSLLKNNTPSPTSKQANKSVETEWARPQKLYGPKAAAPRQKTLHVRKKRELPHPKLETPTIVEENTENKVEARPDIPSRPIQLVYTPDIKLPDWIEDMLPTSEATLEFDLTMGPSIRKLKLARSSGVPEVDQFCHQFIMKRWIFKAATWQGELIESKKRIRIQIRPD